MLGEVTGAAVRVNVIAHCNCKIKSRLSMRIEHLFSGANLIALTRAAIADKRETQPGLRRLGGKYRDCFNGCSRRDFRERQESVRTGHLFFHHLNPGPDQKIQLPKTLSRTPGVAQWVVWVGCLSNACSAVFS